MPNFLISLFTELASVVGGGVVGAFNLVLNVMQKGFGAAMQFHQEGIALARDLGLSASQAQSYTQALTKSTIKLANEYGVTADAIKAIQRGISEATGRQLLLNEAQREQFVIVDKLVGAQTRNEFTAEIMNKLGGQVTTVQGAISKAYATAAKQGLNASKFSEKVAKNLSLANKLSFKNGIDGIIKMTALSEKLGFNLQSVGAAANKFMELDSAIASSAQLQMLGGAAGAYGSNPLTMAYEANYDPEAFTERMTKMLGGYATFNTKTGVADVNGMNKDFVKAIGDAMGIGMEEAMTIAKKQSEVKFKEARFSTDLGAKFGNNTDLKNYFLNNSTYNTKTNELELNGVSLKDIDESELRKIMELSAKSDHELMVEQARALTSLPEQIKATGDKVVASFAEGIEHYIPDFRNQVKKIGDFLSGHAKNWGQSVGTAIANILEWTNKNGSKILDTTKKVFNGIDKLINTIGPIIKWVLDNPWKSLFAAIIGKSILGAINPMKGGNTTLGGKLASKALGGIWKGLKGLFTTSRDTNIATRMGYADARASGSGRFMSALKAPFRGASLLSTSQKIANVGGAALGVGISAAQGIMAQSAYKDQLDAINRGEWDRERYKTKEEAMAGAQTERNEGVGGAVGSGVGTVIGTILGGPVGAMIGGAIGKFAGEYIGKNWTKITDWFSKGWDKVVKYFTSIDWGKVGETLISVFLPPVGAIIQVVKHWDEISTWFSEKWDGAMSKLSGLWQDIKDGWNSYIAEPFNEYIIKPVKETIKWVDENIWRPIKNFFARVKEGWDKLMGGIQRFIDDPLGTIKQGAKNTYEEAKGWAKDKYNDAKAWVKDLFGFETGGIVGGNSYSGDNILTGLNSGEMVLNKDQQAQLFKFIQNASSILTKVGSSNGVTYYNASNRTSNSSSNNTLSNILSTIFNSNSNVVSSALNTNNNIKTTPFGENSFRKIPKSDYTEYSYNNGGEISVKDINVNINGTLKLDANGLTKDLDINSLLSNTAFVSQLKELVTQSINTEMNGGRFLSDNSTRRGGIFTSSWGLT